MSVDILLKFGKTPPVPQSIPLKSWPEQVKAVATVMRMDGAKTLEQEVMDPRRPE
jgi:hypothetical protein